MNKDSERGKPLGEGIDLTGRHVEYWGSVWTVTGKNCFGDWNVETTEQRPSGKVKVASSIDPYELPTQHPHYARLVLAH